MNTGGVSRTQQVVYAILGVSALTLLSALGWGIATGALSAGGAAEGRAAEGGASGSDGGPTALLGTSRGSFDNGGDRGNQGILVLSDGGTRLQSVHVPGGTVAAEVTLPGQARAMVPTPGGVSVWVTFEDRGEIEVYSTTDLEHEATIDPPPPENGNGEAADGGSDSEAGSGEAADGGGRDGGGGGPGQRRGPPEHLTFSETGETLFVTWAESSTISVYRHEMRELTFRDEIDAEGTEGPVFRNRRATRLFRRDEDGGLAVFFAQNGQRMGRVEGTHFAEDPTLTFSADYTEAWGSTSAGNVVGMDEATSTAVVASNEVAPGHAPVLPEGGGTAVYVGERERGIVALDTSGIEISEATGGDAAATAGDATTDAGNEIASLPQVQQLELSDTAGISARRVASLAHTDDGALVVVTTRGELVTVDPSTFEVVSVAEVGSGDDDAGAAGGAGGSAGDGADDGAAGGVPERVVAWSVKEDGNFACF